MLTMEKRLYQGALRCPVCGGMTQDRSVGAGCWRCTGARVHMFDMAKSGYVHLAPRHSGGGDAKEAVRARTAFLSAGYYHAAAEALCQLTKKYVRTGLIVDAGCGEGYYTNALAQHLGEGYEVCGFDLSRDAVDAAAKAAKRQGLSSQYAVGSVFELPLGDATVDGVVNVFAPCAEGEYSRVLKSGGVLIVVGAGERHLLGLKRAIYDETYENAGRADLPVNMRLCERITVRDEIVVEGGEQIANLFSMTPYYWRTSQEDKKKLECLDQLSTEIEFDFSVYVK
jgi:23S rRNA (guanine745-N1)-methyltransferase